MPTLRFSPLPLLAGLLLLAGSPAQSKPAALPPEVAQALARAQVPTEAVSLLVSEAGGHGAPLLSLHADGRVTRPR